MGAAEPRRPTDLDQQLAALDTSSTADLRARWQKIYGNPPPSRLSRYVLLLAAAYHLQEKALGGLRPSLLRRLMVYAEPNAASKNGQAVAATSLKPGTVLLREWHGATYNVQIIEGGVLFEGKTYRSLSKVASVITCQRWSGPKFFGLHSPLVKRDRERAAERMDE